MKYDVDLALDDPNTSHAQVIDLVGTGRRVLDVGCSTGALGRALKARSNRVWGLEIDPEAAQAAEADLEEVVVGDVESMDLHAHFDRGSFDVVIFADVLEHLRDPVAALQKAIGLLAPGGSVVVSLPNVAHGAVRLALLEGRFEYRPLGLLDDTHLRFFTRRSVEDLVRTAGLIAVDMRRTTADVFETEIPLSPQSFDTRVVEQVRAQPDASTYQFVFRAVPLVDGQAGDLTTELVARNEELSALRAEVTRIHALAERYAPPHSVAVLVDSAGGPRPWDALRTSVTSLELRRRIDHLALVHVTGDPDGVAATWRGEPVEGHCPLDAAVAELWAGAYDAVVLPGQEITADTGAFLADVADRGCPVLPFGVPGRRLEALGDAVRNGAARTGRDRRYEGLPGVMAVPDPLVLADRLVGGHALAPRLDFLRLTGRLAVRRPYLVVVADSDDTDLVPALGRTVAELGTVTDCQVVVLPGPGGAGPMDALAAAVPGACALGDPHEIDILALVHEARLVVTDAAPVAAATLAVHTPLLAYGADEDLLDLADWSADPDLVVKTPAEMLGRVGLADARAADGSLLPRLQAPVELAYDDVAGAVRAASGRRLALSMAEVLELHRSRIAAVEQANAVLQGRMISERNLLGARAQELARERGDREPPTPLELAQMQHRIAAAEGRAAEDAHGHQAELAETVREVQRLQAELDAVMATRTMRMVAPARRLYGRLRRS